MKINLNCSQLILEDKLKLDINQSLLISESSLGCDALSQSAIAIYESACELGILTRIENAHVTYGNWNE